MESSKLFKKAIEQQNSGKRYPAARMVRENPKAAAVFSKLITDRRTNIHNQDGSRYIPPPNAAQFRQVAMTTSQSVADAETVMQILPDTNLCAQILISSILSPQDMMSPELTYISEPGKWKLPHEISSALINRSRTHFEQVYKIKPLLPKILHDVLFRTGSWACAVIPENAVDELINGSRQLNMESLSSTLTPTGQMVYLGAIGPNDAGRKVAEKAASMKGLSGVGMVLESLSTYTSQGTTYDGEVKLPFPKMEKLPNPTVADFVPNVTVTDNYDILKIPEISQKIRENKIMAMMGGNRTLSVESIHNRFSDQKLTSTLYKNPRTTYQTIAIAKSQDRLSRRAVGNPLIMHLPSEAVIPVHVPNRPDRQIGFFILLDTEGNPISKSDGTDYYQEMGQRMEAGNSFASSMLERSKQTLGDNFGQNSKKHIDYSIQVYGQMLEEELLQRVRNGILGNNAVIAKDEEIYRLMMARSFANQHTQMLFVPAEFMTYVAFRFKSNGIGKSILEDGKILNSMRTMLLIGNVMTSLRNSIGRTHVELKLDPEAPDPMKQIEMGMFEVMRSNNQAFPLGVSNPVDIVDYMQKSAFEWSITGHPGLPDMSIDFSEKNSNYAKPDTDLEDMLRKRSIMMYGLTPEQVDAAGGADFAASVNNNSLLMSKRVLTHQEEFTPFISSHCRQVLVNTSEVTDDLIDIINAGYDDIIKLVGANGEKLDTGKEVQKAELKTNDIEKATAIKEILEEFIQNFQVKLPEPDVTKTDNQNEAYEKQEKLVDATLNAWISTEMMSNDLTGDINGQVEGVKAMLKAYFLRNWQISNGIMPELSKLTARGEDGKPELDIMSLQAEHVKSIMESVGSLFTTMKKFKETSNKTLEKAGVGGGGGGYDDQNNDQGGAPPAGGDGNLNDSFDDFPSEPLAADPEAPAEGEAPAEPAENAEPAEPADANAPDANAANTDDADAAKKKADDEKKAAEEKDKADKEEAEKKAKEEAEKKDADAQP